MGYELVGGAEVLSGRLARWGYLKDGRSLEEAIALYQQNHGAALDELAARYHGRLVMRSKAGADIDGDIGPATAQLLNSRFCDCADVLPNAAIAEANWPDSCRRDITLSWNFKNAPGLTETDQFAVWKSVKDEYERLFDLQFVLRAEQGYGSSRINAKLLALPGSVLAWSYLATSNCADRLQQAYDSTIRWSVNLAIGTWKHEVGHALGMNHTPSDPRSLMYPSMNGQTGLNATDIAQMERIGYKRRTAPPPVSDWSMF
ncbi:MAG TPA: matrixin family metalloprotease [Anaerolineales bacterium]|nr:matrixin family metalloprotease [Anaerolineales bacterium]